MKFDLKPEEIEAANVCGIGYLRENCRTEPRFTFGERIPSAVGDRATLIDDEGEFVMEVAGDVVTAGALVALNLIYEKGRQNGIIDGRFEVRQEVWRALAPGMPETIRDLTDADAMFFNSSSEDVVALSKVVGLTLAAVQKIAARLDAGRSRG